MIRKLAIVLLLTAFTVAGCATLSKEDRQLLDSARTNAVKAEDAAKAAEASAERGQGLSRRSQGFRL